MVSIPVEKSIKFDRFEKKMQVSQATRYKKAPMREHGGFQEFGVRNARLLDLGADHNLARDTRIELRVRQFDLARRRSITIAVSRVCRNRQ